ncbi:DUF262 domain-containing HNH endonuclease family protein [Bosea sp. TWI1241]|uniref:DUF262 domain-containing protein n=1 Tax=Bosea sp. TWI1241 TaxID=3148904 RepID=UPI003208258A
MIEAHQHTVSEVLGDRFLHEIPPYQRPYAWTPDEAKQLLIDLVEAVGASTDEPYFLGSIVLIRPKGQIAGQVVDGQQRLTTLTILAAVLRDVAVDEREKAALTSVVYIEPNPFAGQVEAVRVKAHDRDRGFFKDSIQMPGATAKSEPSHEPKNEAQELMWENAQALRSLTLELPAAERQKLVAFLLTKCVLVVVSTESRAAALRIFRVLNDRGLDLSNADVIKADLLDKFNDAGEMAHQAERWREFENDLGRDEFEGLLENLRFIREEMRSRRTLSEAYNERFHGVGANVVREFFDKELAPAHRQYMKILDGDSSDFPADLRAAASEALAGLLLLPNRDWTAVAIAAALKLGQTPALVQLLERLEGLAWIMQLGRRYDTQRLNRYVSILRGLKLGAGEIEHALTPTGEEIADAWSSLNGPVYGRFPTRVVRAMLERLDRLMAEQPVVWEGQKTVEHILPQNPQDGSWTQFSEDQRETITHTLGNLVLLTSRKNSGASNMEFQNKVDVYFGLGAAKAKKRATYASAQELAHLKAWDHETYADRHRRHTRMLAARWRIPMPTSVA